MTLYGATKANRAKATGGHVHYNAWGPMLFSFFVAQIFLAKTREGSKGRKKAKNVRPRTSVDTDRLVIDRSELFSIWISKLNWVLLPKFDCKENILRQELAIYI